MVVKLLNWSVTEDEDENVVAESSAVCNASNLEDWSSSCIYTIRSLIVQLLVWLVLNGFIEISDNVQCIGPVWTSLDQLKLFWWTDGNFAEESVKMLNTVSGISYWVWMTVYSRWWANFCTSGPQWLLQWVADGGSGAAADECSVLVSGLIGGNNLPSDHRITQNHRPNPNPEPSRTTRVFSF